MAFHLRRISCYASRPCEVHCDGSVAMTMGPDGYAASSLDVNHIYPVSPERGDHGRHLDLQTAQGNAVRRTLGADDIEQVLEAAVHVVVRARALDSRVVLELLYDRVDVVALFREQLLDYWGGTVAVKYLPVNFNGSGWPGLVTARAGVCF